MKWGFNWDLGPFEMLDAIGVKKFVDSGGAGRGGGACATQDRSSDSTNSKTTKTTIYHINAGEYREVPRPAGTISLSLLTKSNGS